MFGGGSSLRLCPRAVLGYTVAHMNKTTWFYLSLLSGLWLLPVPVFAADVDDPDVGNPFIEGPKWQESEVAIPAFPNPDELLTVQVDHADMPFVFRIDPDSVSVDKDGVSRYTVVIESNSGARNVLYEGIRCSTNEYRTYAYGTYDNEFSKAQSDSWAKIAGGGAMAHRYNFKRYYMCDDYGRPLPVKEILRRIRYPDNFATSGAREY